MYLIMAIKDFFCCKYLRKRFKYLPLPLRYRDYIAL